MAVSWGRQPGLGTATGEGCSDMLGALASRTYQTGFNSTRLISPTIDQVAHHRDQRVDAPRKPARR